MCAILKCSYWNFDWYTYAVVSRCKPLKPPRDTCSICAYKSISWSGAEVGMIMKSVVCFDMEANTWNK